jgi:polyisoprenyl-teichoic acid--peptidoglycan teichoic acid transferase
VSLAVALAGCSGGGNDTTTAPTTTSATTTQEPTTSTTPPLQTVGVSGDVDGELGETLAGVLSWRLDQRNPDPAMPKAMAEPLLEMDLTIEDAIEVTSSTAALENGEVAIVRTASGDVFAAADDGQGWQIVGAGPASGGGWFGDEPRRVLVIGSDARPGQTQERYRADSIHVLTARASDGEGTILGFPRDTWIATEYGTMKLSSVMAGRGPEAITDVMRNEYNLPLEGYVVTGFAGFEELMWDLGELPIDLPRGVPNQAFWSGFSAGEQTMSPPRVLQYARTRKGVPGGDLGRSANQGLVMLAILRLIQDRDVLAAPFFLDVLERHTWTDLPPSTLIQLAATAFRMDADAIDNEVMPGTIGTAGGGSVVFLDDGYEAILADLVDDGILGEGSPDG